MRCPECRHIDGPERVHTERFSGSIEDTYVCPNDECDVEQFTRYYLFDDTEIDVRSEDAPTAGGDDAR